ncbi:MAG: Type II secretion system protein E [SAR92 bacterium MED-G29]|jgi:general secretion pathway protein E|nr:MAG: Type II secretion system protein E [SAR92 bacterium MED-G29]|tara:strand:- start:5645 stop:7423 length:1779 start_codon:yes stop_codon:yes gene_type:complete
MHKVKARGSTLNLGWLLKELVSDGSLTQTDANSIAAKQRSRDEALLHPLRIIASRQCCHAKTHKPLTLETLCQWLADRAKLDFASIDPLKINVPAVTAQMSFAYAKRYGILCLEVSPEELVVATAEPFDLGWIESLEQTSKRTVRPVVANPVDIEKYLVEFYSLAKSVFGAGAGAGSAAENAGIANFEQLLEVGKLKDPDAQDQHIVNIVDWLLQYAFEQRASDIHLEPRRDKSKVRFRIDGILHLVYELPGNVMTAMVSRLKILGRMDVAEKRRPQDGRIKTVTPNGNEVELRLSTMPTAFGEKLVMRIFDPDVLLRNFTQLGLVDQDYIHWRAMTLRSHGIVLVTGPTGSGKTTTLYSTLKSLAEESVNVSTIEDPIEMVVDAFNQSQIQPAIDFDFAAGIRTLMRQDPDIIMVGEIRDRETAEMAVQAALTGHLVISTLHTNDAPTAISRLLDLGMPVHLLKATLNGIMAQRLMRTLCMNCRVQVATDAHAWQELVQPFKLAAPKQVYQPGGCLECRNTGYAGRQGVYEIMPLTKQLMSNISATGDIQTLRETAVKMGMKPLRLAGAEKVIMGVTSIEEVMRVTPEWER